MPDPIESTPTPEYLSNDQLRASEISEEAHDMMIKYHLDAIVILASFKSADGILHVRCCPQYGNPNTCSGLLLLRAASTIAEEIETPF